MFEKNLNKEFLEFYKIYKKKPIDVNDGGMKMPHMFGLYCLLRKLILNLSLKVELSEDNHLGY